jgi:cytochrome c
MKTMLTAVAWMLAFVAAGPAHAQATAEDLVKSSGCTSCHDKAVRKVGPSWKDIAAKFKGSADADKLLVAQLKEGRGHPVTKASEADITTMVKFVLAQ